MRFSTTREALLVQASQMFTWWHRVREGTLQRSTFRAYMTPLRREVERLLAVGSACAVPKTAGTCRDILKRRQALWTFVQIAGVEPTNNAAERAIRPGVLWRKGSFGTQSVQGSRFVECMLTVVSTLQQKQRNVLAYLTMACAAALRGEAAPSLLPAHPQKTQAAARLLFPLPERVRVKRLTKSLFPLLFSAPGRAASPA
jgi:transposase